MDQFQDGHQVRLRSRVHGTFLRADKDWRGVSLHPRRASLNTAWTVTHFASIKLPAMLDISLIVNDNDKVMNFGS